MFIISEISPQFGSDLDLAEQMILQSKYCGANAVKLQLYPHDLFSRQDGLSVKYRELSYEGFKRLKLYGDKIGIDVFATAFTEDRLEWCSDLNQKYYKVAARQHIENPHLVRKILEMGKETFVSIPLGWDDHVKFENYKCIFLFCINKYPTLLHEMTLPHNFNPGIHDGLSDHSLGIAAAVLAAARGARYLEKHFTLSKTWQKSTERAHLGAMDHNDLQLIKNISEDFELMESPPWARKG